MPNHRIDTLLDQARVAIHNTQANDRIQTYLAEFGYTTDRMKDGQALYEAALTAYNQQKAKYGDQIGATASFKTAFERAKKSYMKLIKLARIAFKDDTGATKRLGLKGDRATNFAAWILQANQFYSNLLSSAVLIEQMTTYGMTLTKIQAGQADLHALEEANLAQEQGKGNAQNSTQTRDAALEALKIWVADFTKVARIALEAEPQLLESLGILKPS
jgi:hypothetical protein